MRATVSEQNNNIQAGRGRAPLRHALVAFTVAAALLCAGQASAAIAVVVSAGSDLSSMSQGEVRAVFLGKKRVLPNGVEAAPVNQPEKSAIYDAFNEEVLEKPSSKVLQYWARRVFSGKGSPPQTLDDDAAVKSHVQSTQGGIGYIDSASVDDSVKVVYQAE